MAHLQSYLRKPEVERAVTQSSPLPASLILLPHPSGAGVGSAFGTQWCSYGLFPLCPSPCPELLCCFHSGAASPVLLTRYPEGSRDRTLCRSHLGCTLRLFLARSTHCPISQHLIVEPYRRSSPLDIILVTLGTTERSLARTDRRGQCQLVISLPAVRSLLQGFASIPTSGARVPA